MADPQALKAEIARREKALAAVRAVHRPDTWIHITLCLECRKVYPCKTLRTIEEALK